MPSSVVELPRLTGAPRNRKFSLAAAKERSAQGALVAERLRQNASSQSKQTRLRQKRDEWMSTWRKLRTEEDALETELHLLEEDTGFTELLDREPSGV